jgi:hypothetical protein
MLSVPSNWKEETASYPAKKQYNNINVMEKYVEMGVWVVETPQAGSHAAIE